MKTQHNTTELQSLVYRLALKLDEYDLFDIDVEARMLQNEVNRVAEGKPVKAEPRKPKLYVVG